MRTYSELIRLPTFMDRYEYLRVTSSVGIETFGFNRYLNQSFYHSRIWRDARREVIIRDDANDLGIVGMDIFDKVIVHHMNPITAKQIEDADPDIFDPEFLITVSHRTHEAIHYGDAGLLPALPIERKPRDTCLW